MILLESCLGLPKWEFPIQIPPFGQPVFFSVYSPPSNNYRAGEKGQKIACTTFTPPIYATLIP